MLPKSVLVRRRPRMVGGKVMSYEEGRRLFSMSSHQQHEMTA